MKVSSPVLGCCFDFTYNLVVADFHTYCVGASLILNHDNTQHEPTTGEVPGLTK